MENQKHIEAYQELFNYLHDEHGLILLRSEMDVIIKLSENVKLKYNEASVQQANELLPHVSNAKRKFCRVCNGTGKHGDWITQKTCPICKGSGRQN